MKKPPARTASGGFFLTDRDSLSSQLWVVSISIAISERKQVQALQFTIPTFHRKPATSYRTPLRMNPVQELYQEQYNDFLLKNKGFLGKRYILLDQGSDTCTQVSNPLFSVSYTGLLYEKYTKNQEKNWHWFFIFAHIQALWFVYSVQPKRLWLFEILDLWVFCESLYSEKGTLEVAKKFLLLSFFFQKE